MHLLLIHQAFSAPNDPGGTRHYEFARRLHAMGHRVTVVTSPYSYLTGEEKIDRASLDGINVRFAPTISGLHDSYVRRVLVFLTFMVSSVFTAFAVSEVDVVIGTSPPIFQAFSAWIVAALRRSPFLLEVRDLWPEFAIELGMLRNPLLIYLARALERFLYRRADHIIVNSPAYRDYLLAKGIQESVISLVANGVDASMFHPEDRGETFRCEFGLEGKVVVMYAGALGIANDIDCLLRAASHVRQDPEIVFVIVGNGKELSRLQHEAKSMDFGNVRFVPAQPKQRMPEVLAAADVCIATLKDIPMFRMTYPNKVFDYMAAGRPTVLAIDGVIREVIEAARGGLFVPPGDDDTLAETILKLRDSPELRREMGRNARNYVALHFDRDTRARKFAELLIQVSRMSS